MPGAPRPRASPGRTRSNAASHGRGNSRETVTTKSPEAQAFYNQGLNYLESYVWVEASRSLVESWVEALRGEMLLRAGESEEGATVLKAVIKEPSKESHLTPWAWPLFLRLRGQAENTFHSFAHFPTGEWVPEGRATSRHAPSLNPAIERRKTIHRPRPPLSCGGLIFP